MRKMIVSVLACSMMAIGIGTAAAQSTCKGKVVVNLYQEDFDGNRRFSYSFEIRNNTDKEMRADVRLKNMPSNATFVSKSFLGIPLRPRESQKVKIGGGTNHLFLLTFKFYDTDDVGYRPSIIVTNCR